MKTSVFIDGANFYQSMRRFDQKLIIDYDKLKNWLVESVSGSICVGVHYFVGVSDDTFAETNKFLDGLETRPGYFVHRSTRLSRVGYCTRCKQPYKYSVEKQNDVRLATMMVQMAAQRAFDICILLSGDEDFVPAIKAVNSFGQQTWIATWGGEVAGVLRKNAFGQIDLKHSVQLIARPQKTEEPTLRKNAFGQIDFSNITDDSRTPQREEEK